MRSRSEVAVISRPPSLPSASTATCWPGKRPCCDANVFLDRRVQRTQQHVGQPRKDLARLLRRHRARQDARADQEHLLLAEHAHAIEKVFVGVRLLQRPRKALAEPLLVRQHAEEARIDQPVHHLRIAGQNVGEPRRGAEHERDERDQIRILPQQRQQSAAAVQTGTESGRTRKHAASGFSERAN